MSATPSSRHWLRRHRFLLLLSSPILFFVAVQAYWGILSTFFQYEIGSDINVGQRQLEKALAARDPHLCRRIIVTQLMPGPEKRDVINGCYSGYATKTGDVSLCMGVISAGGCVTRIAKERNDPSLCEQAIDPQRWEITDNRGSCFGYFAKREKDYSFCSRLESLESMNESQKNICMMLYVDTTGDPNYCSVHDEPDICFNKAARISGNIAICNNIDDPEIKKRCIDAFKK